MRPHLLFLCLLLGTGGALSQALVPRPAPAVLESLLACLNGSAPVHCLEGADSPRYAAATLLLESARPLELKRRLVDALGAQRDSRAVLPLSRLLDGDLGGSDVAALRPAAIQALARTARPEAAPALLRAWERSTGDERQVLVQALARLPDPEAALPPLLDLLDRNPDPALRGLAAEALRPLQDPRVLERWPGLLQDRTPAVRRAALQALRERGDRRHAAAVAALAARELDAVDGGADPSLAAQALDTLRALEPRGETALFRRAAEPRPVPRDPARAEALRALRVAGLRGLGASADPAAVRALVDLRAFHDADAAVRTEGIRALVALGDVRMLSLYTGLLRDREPAVRLAMAEALGELRAAQAVWVLRRVLDEETDATVRAAAARALERLPAPGP